MAIWQVLLIFICMLVCVNRQCIVNCNIVGSQYASTEINQQSEDVFNYMVLSRYKQVSTALCWIINLLCVFVISTTQGSHSNTLKGESTVLSRYKKAICKLTRTRQKHEWTPPCKQKQYQLTFNFSLYFELCTTTE